MKQYLIILLLSASLLVNAGENRTSSVRGTIKGEVTSIDGEKLIGANVFLKNTNIGTITNKQGQFEIPNVPVGKYGLIISMMGYKSHTSEVMIEKDKELQINAELNTAFYETGSVVITGTTTPYLYEESPVKTEVIPRKLIEQTRSTNLAEALCLQTGVMVENDCNNCNFTQVRILGFEGKYSQILIDGDPVVSSLGGVYGLEHYPQEMIEQIEIVKGGGSALYGGGAVAGTINMKTRRPWFNRSKVNFSGSSIDGSYDQEVGALAEIVSEDNKSGFFIFGSTRNRDSYDRNGDGYSELGVLKNETIGVNGFLKPWEGTDIQISFHRIFEERRGGGDFDKPVHEAGIAEWTQHFKWGGKLKWNHQISSLLEYKVNFAFSLLERDSYYGGLSGNTEEERLEALNYYGFSDNPLYTADVQLKYILGSHALTFGTQYDYDKLTDESVSSEAYHIAETFKNTGIYIQDELSIDSDDHTKVVAGVRLDKHSALSDWIVSPRINLKHEIIEGLTVRTGYTTGFKAPQIFDEDLHICGLEGTQRVIRNSDELKEERSSSFNLGFEFQNNLRDIPILIGVTGFYTKLSDAYADEFISTDGTIEYWERINSSGAEVKGIEIDLGVKPVRQIEIRGGLTVKDNHFEDTLEDFDTDNFLRTPDVFGYIRTSYDISNTVSTFISLKYTGSMYVPHEISVDYQENPLLELTKSDDFLEIDVSLTKKLNLFGDVNTSMTLGIKNLTDAYQKDLDYGINRDPAYVYGTSLPRTLFLGVDISL